MRFNKTEYKGKIIGMVLGDGYLSTGRKNSYLKLKHSEKQRNYLEHKVEILKTLTSVNLRNETTVLGDKEHKCCICETKSHPVYTKLREQFYHHGRKTVTEHLMKLLTDEGLAYWYLDDGGWGGGSAKQDARICTECFNKVEQELMCYWLAKKFSLHFKPIKYRNSFRLRLVLKETDKLVDIIKPFTPESMAYKLKFDDIKNCAKELVCNFCGEKFYPKNHKKIEDIKFCSISCSQKSLFSMGRSNLVSNKLRRYSLNSEVTQRV